MTPGMMLDIRMLRETFDGLADARQAHIDDHRSLHRRGNTAIHADDHATLADACAAAEQHDVPHVLLNPCRTYTLTETLVVPPQVTLDGDGGDGMTSTWYGNHAKIVAGAQMDALIHLSNYANVRGCWLDGEGRATAAISAHGIFNQISGCLITNAEQGLRLGGTLYTTIRRNIFNGIGGYAVDALSAYRPEGSNAYYGVNVGLSEGNSYLGTGIRVEGILTSLQDDFEGRFDQPWVQVGGTFQSHMQMYAPYMEIKRNVEPIVGVYLAGNSKFSMRDGQVHGQIADADATFISIAGPNILHVSGCHINRFATVFAGSVGAGTNVSIYGNFYTNHTTVNAIAGLDQAESVFCVWPGDKIGLPS